MDTIDLTKIGSTLGLNTLPSTSTAVPTPTINTGSVVKPTTTAQNWTPTIPTVPTIISSANMSSSPNITLPTPPTDNTNYQGTIDGVAAQISSIKKALDTLSKGETKTQEDPVLKYIRELEDQTKQPEADTGALESYVADSQKSLDPLKEELENKKAIQRAAQNEFNLIDAQIQGLIKEGQAVPIRLQEEATGRGITAGGLAPIQAGELRKVALRALPLQAAAYTAQAKVLTAQGDTQGAQEALNVATTSYDKLFALKQQDLQNTYTNEMKAYEALQGRLTKAEERRVDELKEEKKNQFAVAQDEIAYQRDIAKIKLQNTLEGNTQAPTIPENQLYGMTEEQRADPFITKMMSTKGGKPITDTFAQKIDKGLVVLSQIGALQTNIENVKTGPILGLFKGNNPWDTNAQTIKAQLNAIVPNLARGVYGEVGVLTDNDIANYSKTLPNLKSTEDVRNAVLGITVDMIGRSIKNTLEVNAANGKDVSGFIDLYTEMKATRDSIFAQISEDQAGDEDTQVFDSVVSPESSSWLTNLWNSLF